MGGDDITEFLYVLLERINFPYKDIDLAQSYDWSIMEDLKSRLCTLAEVSYRESHFEGFLLTFGREMLLSIFTISWSGGRIALRRNMVWEHMTKQF